jgi:DNA-binding LytR/AlgR family response regulator
MMQVMIIEDEALAAERLASLLHQYDPTIQVVAITESIEESVKWLQTHAHPHLLLADIHLSDGASFEIFKRVPIHKPVVFTTAFDAYAIDAFQLFSIDYIMKPVTAESLAAALNKYRSIAANFFPSNYALLGDQVKESINSRYKNRFLAKIGQRSFFIQTAEVACFTADNKTLYLCDVEGNRFMISGTLEKLEPQLDPHHCFRINRKMIVHSAAIEQIKPYFNSRLKLQLKGIRSDEDAVVSRERVSLFRTWAEG